MGIPKLKPNYSWFAPNVSTIGIWTAVSLINSEEVSY